MIKAVIVDDEPSACEVIQSLIKVYGPEYTVCQSCHTIDDAVSSIYRHQPDILFLDIELADGSGFEILEKFSELHARVVFITAYEHYALKAIKHNAFDYILKPIVPDEFKQVLDKVTKEIKKSEPLPDSNALLQLFRGGMSRKIGVPTRNGLHYYPVDDIVVLQGEGSYTNMHLAGGEKVLVTKILKDFESSLRANGFLRVHKSFLVNINHITELRKEDSGCLLMSNGETVPISQREKDEVISLLKAYSPIV